VLAVLSTAPAVAGSLPVLEGIQPPGVQAGETVVWTVSGRALAGVERFLISGSGVEVVVIGRASDESIRLSVRASADALLGFREFRAIGPAGISNLLLFRVDMLPQSLEAEPNDEPAQANPRVIPTAVAGVLVPQDLDRYSFEGRKGQGVTIEVEARRLGSAIVPRARLLGPSGVSLAQSQPMREGGGDCRLSFILPGDGWYLVEVRDALYRGSAAARYRLRIDTGPFATGLFPLGGRRDKPLLVTASGGNLTVPWHKTISLPAEPGATVAAGLFAGPGGSLLAPGRLVAGNGPEIEEPPGSSGTAHQGASMRLPFGATVNGRIDRLGEVDRYSVTVPPEGAVQVEVLAAALGSWLDSVVTLVDGHGNPLAEADDRGIPARRAAGLEPGTLDSRLEVEVPGGGELVVAISDRFGDGGPEYGYRLFVGPPRGDFAVTLQLGGRGSGSSPGIDASGACNLRPGTTVSLPLQITSEGRPGPITLRAVGLPPGVVADPLTVRIPRAPRGVAAVPVEATLGLRVDSEAESGTGSLKILASARIGVGDPKGVTRRASAMVVLAPLPEDDLRPSPTWLVTEFPMWIVAPEAR
jgi:hypothetical protein